MIYILRKTWIYILLILILTLWVLNIYGAFNENINLLNDVLKNVKFYTTLFALNSPLISIIVTKYNRVKMFMSEDKIRSKNAIYDFLEGLQDSIKLFEQKYRADKASDFSEINGDINMSLSKLTKELVRFYEGKTEVADSIVGTAIFEKVNVLSNGVEMAEIKEASCEIQNIDNRVRKKIQKSLIKIL